MKLGMSVGVVLLTASLVWAKPLDFNDTEFDYSDDGVDTAYVSLAKNDTGGLEIDFSSQASENAIATVDVEDQVLGYDTDGEDAFWEESAYRTNEVVASRFSDVDLDFRGNTFQRVTFLHQDQTFEVVREEYMAKLEELGFALTEEESSASVDIYTLQIEDDTVRVIFVDQGSDTQVTFTQS